MSYVNSKLRMDAQHAQKAANRTDASSSRYTLSKHSEKVHAHANARALCCAHAHSAVLALSRIAQRLDENSVALQSHLERVNASSALTLGVFADVLALSDDIVRQIGAKHAAVNDALVAAFDAVRRAFDNMLVHV